MHQVSACCRGETCSMCGRPATHKVEEHIFDDAYPPNEFGVPYMRHPLTAYICCNHFVQIMGPAANRDCQIEEPARAQEPKRERHIRVKVSPGMFSSERCVSFTIQDRHYCSLVDEHSVVQSGEDGLLDVYLLQDMGEGKVRIQLPRETFTTGSQIVVPWDYIV